MQTTEISTGVMEKREISITKVAMKTGLAVCGGLLLYFFAMAAVDLLRVVELRALNFFILLTGILYSINYVKNHKGNQFDYFEGLAAGFLTTIYSVIPFGVFVFIYLWQINPSFMEYIRENVMFGNSLTPALAAFAILVEGIASGAVISFIAMQYFKRFAKRPR